MLYFTVFRISSLISFCCYNFSGKLSFDELKLSCLRQATQNGTNIQKLSSLRRNMGSEFSCMIKEAKFLGLALGIPCLDG